MNGNCDGKDMADYATGTTPNEPRRSGSGSRFVNDTFRATALGCEGEPLLAPTDQEEDPEAVRTSDVRQKTASPARTGAKNQEDDDASERTLMRMGGNGF